MKLKINSSTLENNCNKLSKVGEIYYPLKANSSIDIIERLSGLGIMHTLISSDASTFGVTQSVYRNSTVINTLLDTSELIKLYSKGVRSFVFDNFIKMGGFLNTIMNKSMLEITAKLSLNEIAYSHFNTGATKDEVKQMLNFMKTCSVKCGCSIYINKAVRRKVNIEDIKGLLSNLGDIDFISVGGIDEYNIDWIQALGKEVVESGIEFRIEPGEMLLTGAVDCEATIININYYGNNINIHVDVSTYKELYDVAAMGKEIVLTDICGNLVYKNKSAEDSSKMYNIHIFGNSSDSNDYIGKYVVDDINGIDIGGTILLKDIGAYFNRINHI